MLLCKIDIWQAFIKTKNRIPRQYNRRVTIINELHIVVFREITQGIRFR